MAKAAPKAVDTTETVPPIRAKKSTSTKKQAKAPAKKPAKTTHTAGAWIPKICTKSDLSVVLHISIRTLTDLDQRGILVRGAKTGTYQALPSIHSYVLQLRAQASGRSAEVRNPVAEERLKSETIERKIREMKLKELQGEVLMLEEVSESWSTFGSMVKQTFLTFPTKSRAKIPHLTAFDQQTMTSIAKDMLLDLAEEVKASVIGGDADVLKK